MPAIAETTSGFYRVPLPRPAADSARGEMRAFELVTIRVRDNEGAEGTGYTFTSGRNGAAVHAILAREIPEIVRGQDADLVASVWTRIWRELHYGGRGGPTVLALSAFDIALWDLKARRAGLPLYKMLGGFDPRVPCYAGGIDLGLSTDELLRQTDDNLAKGFRAIKMKVGRDNLAEDAGRVAAMRNHLGDEFPLMADANMKWSVAEAVRAARVFAPHNLVWLEEPISPDDPDGHAVVRREGGIPVAAGENLRSVWEFRQLIARGGVSFPEPDVTNCGGVSAFMKIAALAEAFNLPVTSHGAHDITVHLLAAVPNRSYLEAHGFGLEKASVHPFQMEDGFAIAPERPGHGMEFNPDALEAMRAGS